MNEKPSIWGLEEFFSVLGRSMREDEKGRWEWKGRF